MRRIRSACMWIMNDFQELVIVALIVRLPASSLVTPGLHTCAEIAAFVI